MLTATGNADSQILHLETTVQKLVEVTRGHEDELVLIRQETATQGMTQDQKLGTFVQKLQQMVVSLRDQMAADRQGIAHAIKLLKADVRQVSTSMHAAAAMPSHIPATATPHASIAVPVPPPPPQVTFPQPCPSV